MRHALLALTLAGFAGSALGQDLDTRWDGGDSLVPRLSLSAGFGQSGVSSLKLQGVDLMGAPDTRLNATEGGLTGAQWTGIIFTGLVFAVIAVEAADSEDDPMSGTGSY